MIAKPLLPKVSQNIGNIVVRDFRRKGFEQYVTEVIQELEEENPYLAKFVGLFAKNSQDLVSTESAVLHCACIVYKMLRNQAEANGLEETLGR